MHVETKITKPKKIMHFFVLVYEVFEIKEVHKLHIEMDEAFFSQIDKKILE